MTKTNEKIDAIS